MNAKIHFKAVSKHDFHTQFAGAPADALSQKRGAHSMATKGLQVLIRLEMQVALPTKLRKSFLGTMLTLVMPSARSLTSVTISVLTATAIPSLSTVSCDEVQVRVVPTCASCALANASE